MKTLFKIFGTIIVILILLMLLLPLFFKGTLTDIVREEANKHVDATVDFSEIDLTLFKSFPNFNLGIHELTVTGKGTFEGDTLAFIPSLGITIDLMSVVRGSNYTVKKIELTSPSVLLHIQEDGKANYDIALESDTPTQEAPAEAGESNFRLSLQKLVISDATVVYKDLPSGMQADLHGMDFTLSGDLSADETTLRINNTVRKMTLTYGGIPYFFNTHMVYKANIHADLKNEIYTLKKNSLFLNELLLAFDGSISMVEDNINLVLTFNTPKTEFKHILSLVPAIYQKEFDILQASGKIGIDGHVKGLYTENTLPAFHVNLEVVDGEFQYPDLPTSVSDVQIKAGVSNTGGTADNTVVDLSKLHLMMGNNPMDIRMKIQKPVSDPTIDGKIKGTLDMTTIHEFYPLEQGEELTGLMRADVTLKGSLSSIESGAYDAFTAIGTVLLQNFVYESSFTNDPIEISNAQLNFSPQYLDLVEFNCKVGRNDIKAGGKIETYLGYALGDEDLKGSFTTQSNYLNLNELMAEEDAESAAETGTPDTTASGVAEVPDKIDFSMNSSFNTLIYDNMEMTNVNGKVRIQNEKLFLDNLSMNLLDGEMVVDGLYSTSDPSKPEIKFDLNLKDVDIQEAYQTFDILAQYVPIAKKIDGKFSTTVTMNSLLDEEMNLVYETLTGAGRLETSPLEIRDVNTLNKIADALKYDPIREMLVEKILLTFDFVDGKILVEPFDLNNNNFSGQMAGWTGFDQSIDYTMNLEIPRASFGAGANQVLSDLVGQANAQGANLSLGETVSLGVLIGGTLQNPTVGTNLKESGKSMVEDVKKKVEEEIQKQKEELTQQAKAEAEKILDAAEKQANKLIAEAEKQAAAIRKGGADAAKKVRDEAEVQAKKVEAEGKKKGFLAEAAAKETAKQLRKEADKQAKGLENEADKQATDLVNKAKQEAAKIRQNAQQEANNILEGKN